MIKPARVPNILRIPQNSSFIAKFEQLEPDFEAQPPRAVSNQSTGFFLPPDRRNGCKRVGSEEFYRWKGGRMVSVSAIEAFHGANPRRYCCATMFTQKPYTDHLFVVNCNATEHDVCSWRGGWQALSFEHVPQPGSVNRTYSSVAYVGTESHLAAHGSASWMGQLLPRDYDYCRVETHNGTGAPIPPETESAGLTGNLALLLGLAAYSAPPNSLQAALTTSMGPNTWTRHGLLTGRKS